MVALKHDSGKIEINEEKLKTDKNGTWSKKSSYQLEIDGFRVKAVEKVFRHLVIAPLDQRASPAES